ncbi:MAG: hypothetical protein M5R41_10415 [Bacteroidia bacterium]|nr:hypothetical protein [Bacteroidia bacterium]
MAEAELNIAARVISRALLINLGTAALYIIKERTLRGQFLPGSTGSGRYSTTPMPLPLGALPARARGKRALAQLVASGEARLFTSMRSRRAWIVLQGGYAKFRELAGRESDRVTLNWSGQMMRNLKITRVSAREFTVELGFTEGRARRLASYHNELGAGKSRTTHKFLGLTAQEVSRLASDAQAAIQYQQ